MTRSGGQAHVSGFPAGVSEWLQHGRNVYGALLREAEARHPCVIRSCRDTLRKQGHSMLAVLQGA